MLHFYSRTRVSTPCRVGRSVRNISKIASGFRIIAPAQPSATGLPCIRPCLCLCLQLSILFFFSSFPNQIQLASIFLRKQKPFLRLFSSSSSSAATSSSSSSRQLKRENSTPRETPLTQPRVAVTTAAAAVKARPQPPPNPPMSTA